MDNFLIWSIGGIETEILHLTADKSNYGSHVLLFIPGNPGLVGYYASFLKSLQAGTGNKLDIVGCSHGGHTRHSTEILSLDHQVQHKIDLLIHLKSIYPKDTKYYLMGHSMGSYISKEIIKSEIDIKFQKVISLFPTIYNINETPNGAFLKKIAHPISQFILPNAAAIISILPVLWLVSILKMFTNLTHDLAHTSVTNLANKNSLKSVLYLAKHESQQIVELDSEDIKAIQNHRDDWIMYFGKNDGWAPRSYYDNLKERFPDAKIILCDQGMEHAFSNLHSNEMAAKVTEWLNCIEK
jgi:xanthine dehydrogenase/oxidase